MIRPWKKPKFEEDIDSIKREMKGGNNMVKRNIEEDEEMPLEADDELLEEEEKEVRPELKAKPKPQTQVPERKGNVCVAIHQPQLDGAYNTVTQKAIATDVWDMLVVLYNKIDNIERAVGS
jgi:hypothetical protein